MICLLLLPGAARSGELEDLEVLIDSLHLSEARAEVDRMGGELLRSPRGKYLEGRLLFFEGKLSPSLDRLRNAIEGARTEIRWKELRDTVTLAREYIEPLEEVEGASGRFVFRHAGGIDSVLIPYADRALTAQLEVLEEIFDDRPAYKIQVLILPDAEHMSAISGLTVEQIERTGTVGVSKFGKVMVLSPRALSTGYPWLETLAHELTHLFISRSSGEKAPIWLQEGLAKLLESRWRRDGDGELTPQEAYLLDRAARERRLIPLRRFHPSIALLPNQEDAALAYAQVFSFLRYIDGRTDDQAWIRQMMSMISEGDSTDRAFTKIFKFDVKKLFNWWRQTVSGKRQTPVPAVGLMERRYERGATADKVGSEAVFGTEVRKVIRLGDLLRLRGHVGPAVIEYRRALALAETDSPEISDRLGGCLLEQEEYGAAVEALQPVSGLYPFHSTIFVQLGKALVALERYEEAVEALEQALAVNPFHPDVHCVLAKAYDGRGESRLAKLEGANCRLLARSSTDRVDAE